MQQTMDENSQIIKDFEFILKNNARNTPLALYSGCKNTNVPCLNTEKRLNPQDIISNVNKQIRDIQKADTAIPRKQDGKKLYKYKKSSFLPVNMLPREREVTDQKPANRFETQCVSNTQLIDLIDNAEAIANSKCGMTQEFDSTFCENDAKTENFLDESENPENGILNVKNTVENDNFNDNNEIILRNSPLDNLDGDLNEVNEPVNENKYDIDIFSENFESITKSTQIELLGNITENNERPSEANDTQVSENCSESSYKVVQDDKHKDRFVQNDTDINKKEQDDTISDIQRRSEVQDKVISPSPVFIVRSQTPLPLVFDLTSFEKFEKIAYPIIEENRDLTSAKQLINSQIIGKELLIQTNIESDNSITDEQTSPILKISNEKLKITKPPDRNRDLNACNNKDDNSLQVNKSNNEMFLKDEILFSSDEENEYVPKELQDMPLTCALETSFYDEPHVLDKTMYVGFQTASNKSIQISEDSFTKAKSVLDEIEKVVASSTSLTNIVDRLSLRHNSCSTPNNDSTDIGTKLNLENNEGVRKSQNNDLKKIKTDVVSKSEKSSEKEALSLSRPEKRKFNGFMTASNKKIKLSDIALARCKRVFQDIDLEEDYKEECNDDLVNKECKIELDIGNNTQIDDDILQEFSRDMSLVDEGKTSEFVGFKTASEEIIKVSAAAIAKTKNVFDNIINAKNDLGEHLKEQESIKEFVGFKTASSKDITISNTALIKSKEIFQDIIESDNHNLDKDCPKLKGSAFGGFKTANNKEIKISNEALLKTKDIFKNIEKEIHSTANSEFKVGSKQPNMEECDVEMDIKDLGTLFEHEIHEMDIKKDQPFCGFHTASKKLVHISEKALQESTKLFSDIKFNDEYNDKETKPAVLKKYHTESHTNLTDTKRLIDNLPSRSFQKNTTLSFKTANNKPINISEHAMEKCKKLFEDLDVIIDSNNEDEKIAVKDLHTVNRQHISGSDEIYNDAASLNRFTTATNKLDVISSDPLANKALFKDIDSKDQIPISNTIVEHTQPAFKGFLTANNKPIGVSTEALAKGKALFKYLDSDENDSKNAKNDFDTPDNNLLFKGFHTASNKQIGVSLDALEKSKAFFKELNEDNNLDKNDNNYIPKIEDDVTTFKGFQTANNKCITVSPKALARSKLLFKDIDDVVGTNKITNANSSKKSSEIFQGFQTASKKPVKVSAEALAKSKMMFRDIDQNVASTDLIKNINTVERFQGFKTANQKPIALSSEAPTKSQALFKDNNEKSITKKLDNFKGFQTTSKKAVEVSEEALMKSKLELDNIEGYKKNEAVSNQFRGFQTASNKKVSISEESLKKSLQIFQDIDLNNDNYKENIVNKDPNIITTENLDFKKSFALNSAKGDSVQICKESLTESKRRLKDNDDSEEKTKSESNSKRHNVIKTQENNLEKLIDTQIILDFEDTLCTEDFCKNTTPRQSKRSGSPILSCSKAKKRKKFETPYRNDRKNSPIIEDVKILTAKEDDVIFNRDYKKNKRLKLVHLAKVEDGNEKLTIDPYILNFSLETFLNFEFFGQRNDLTNEKLTITDLKDLFLKLVDKKLIPIGWADNHLKLIIWKLISYEIKFPQTLAGVCSAKNVLEQLKYRFNRELYNAERPALRKILEKDDVAARTMVLCVTGIYVDGVNVQSVTNISSNVELLLTDGWYLVKASIDKMLTKLVYDEKITVGCKIVTNCSELINCEQGIAPWEDTSSVRLKIFGNSTRRARWDARLGYHGNPAILSELSAVKPEGGKVSKLRLFVSRAYPMLYVERFEDGSTVTRSERLEHIHQVKCESERQAAMEKLYEEVEKELSDQESQESFGSQMPAKHGKCSSDFKITESQAKSLEDRSNRKRDRLIQNIQERVRRKIEERGLDQGRNVVTLFKVRVAGVSGGDSVAVTKGLMSIWKPNDLLTEIIKEGCWIEVMNVVPTAIRYSEIHLSAGRQSVFRQSKYQEEDHIRPYTESLKRKCYHIKDLAQNPTMTTDYNEIDTVALIFQIDEDTNQPFQNIYLTDSVKNIICVNFWGGLKKFGFQNILEVGQIIYGSNLQKRAGNTRKSIPHFRVTEFTNFTKTPKNAAARSFIDELERKLSTVNRKKYCEECVILKNNFSTKCVTENVSPYRFNNEHYLTKNKVFIDSPLVAKCEDNFNLTGLDFESTFKQIDTQEMSPNLLQQKRMVKQKIAKLKMIGEPPPLSPLNIINKSRIALNHYRSPLAQTSVASPMRNYQDNVKDMQSSPVIQNVNKSYQNTANVARSCQNTVDCTIQSSPVIQDMSKSYQNVASLKQAYQSSKVQFKSSPLQSNVDSDIIVQPNVASLKKAYQNSRIKSDSIQSSPLFSMNRTYVKNVNPVKLNFSNADESLDDVVDHFAEEFDGSPPLSLDSI